MFIWAATHSPLSIAINFKTKNSTFEQKFKFKQSKSFLLNANRRTHTLKQRISLMQNPFVRGVLAEEGSKWKCKKEEGSHTLRSKTASEFAEVNVWHEGLHFILFHFSLHFLLQFFSHNFPVLFLYNLRRWLFFFVFAHKQRRHKQHSQDTLSRTRSSMLLCVLKILFVHMFVCFQKNSKKTTTTMHCQQNREHVRYPFHNCESVRKKKAHVS